jgi:Tat protein secretion system quality control protein TatD with DNase activity
MFTWTVYAPRAVSAMLSRARLAGVRRFLTVGVDLASSAAAVGLARCHRGVLAAIGIHPVHIGTLDLARSRSQREAVSQVPLERLLLETDTYPLPGRTTEPCDVLQVCQAAAELHGVDAGEVSQATTRNFRRVFQKKRSWLDRLGVHDN